MFVTTLTYAMHVKYSSHDNAGTCDKQHSIMKVGVEDLPREHGAHQQ